MFDFCEDMKKRIVTCKLLKGMKVSAFAVILTLSVGLLSACSQAPESATIVAGSTSVQPYAEILAEEYMAQNPEAVIDIQGGGSSAGITATQTHSADIGMSSRALEDGEENLWSVEIAKDGLAIIVNPANPIKNLTSDQIRDIYAAAITDWSQVGGTKSKINIIAREEGSGTRSAFTELLMGEKEITPKAIVQDSNGAVRQLVADDPNAIGFISLGLVSDEVKALHLDGVGATRENIMNNSYKLSREFLFVTNGEPTGVEKSFIDFILSLEGQKLLSKEGLIPAEGAAK